MKKPVSLREFIMFFICLILCFFLFVKKWNNVELESDKARSEEIIKMYEQNMEHQKCVSDSLILNAHVLEGIIEFQKKNPKIIIHKYDKIRDNIGVLNAGQSISYLSGRLSQAGSNR